MTVLTEDELRQNNLILMQALTDIIELFPPNPKLPISFQVLEITTEAIKKLKNET